MALGVAVGSKVGAALSVAITTTNGATVGVGPDDTAATNGLSDPCQLDVVGMAVSELCKVLEPCPIPMIEAAFRTVGHSIRRYTPTTTRKTTKAMKPPTSKPLPAIASRRYGLDGVDSFRERRH